MITIFEIFENLNIQKDIIAIRYDNIPEKLLTEFGKINNIPTKFFNIDYAKTIKELEIKLKTKKYNI